ncbi:MAG: ATP-binding cassette domain-containing protein [Gammaproteobacteria bacterium]|nr:ATP-binding cassette domain-containing protein [Gammaproteobacteria bacterium]MYD79763.1 ATP-binding cassette domain-containing protein [Gammaproteobacteria bacterium]
MQNGNTGQLSLWEIAEQSGVSVPCAGNCPVGLNDSDSVWFVQNGVVDLFMIESRDGVDRAAPQHLMRLGEGNLIPNVQHDEYEDEDGGGTTSLSLICKGLPNAHLKQLSTKSLDQAKTQEVAQLIDSWIARVTNALSRFVIRPPRPTAFADSDTQESLHPCTLSVRRGVVWVSTPSQGSSLFMDMVDQTELALHSHEPVVPLTRTSWLSVLEDVTIVSRSTETLVREGALFSALTSFHSATFHMERLNRQLAVVDEANLERERATSRRFAERTARTRLLNLYEHAAELESQEEHTALVDALKVIGRHKGIQFNTSAKSVAPDSSIELSDVLDASGVRARRVHLDVSNRWWRKDSTALLGFHRENDRPVALIPTILGSYRQYDPVSQKSVRLTRERALKLKDEAWMFYQPLPLRPVGPTDLLKTAFHASATDVLKLLLTGLLGGIVRLLPALALGLVATHLVIGGSYEALYAVAIALTLIGVLATLLQIMQSNSFMRFEVRAASRLEAAFWDRLMRLPSDTLHSQPSGDLAMSGMTFQNLRDGVQGVIANSLLSILFLLPVFGVVFFYDAALGVCVLGFSLISLLVTVYLGIRQISPHGKMIRALRQVAGLLFEIIGGISKLRVENAEGSAFAMWAQEYREQKQAEIEVGTLEGHARSFGVALPFFAAGLLILAVMTLGDGTLPVGDFLIIYAVFIVFQSAIARFGESFGTVVAILPAFDQMRPLLGTTPEDETSGEPVDSLRGDILFDRISFRYDSVGPLILDDVSIRARPGEFIAIAGESGAGKSTLFRLALGLDRPTAGAVYYDGRDLRHLNLKQVRRLIGAVPQSVQLHPQDLWDNIVAHREEPTVDEVWQVARAACIEQEIKAMPMGMMTMVGAGGSVVSGGEGQRISIARALFGSPRVMLLDEATNWLDNESQAEVMQNLALLTSTRIVIAHRLSTLQQADRIYVLKAGKIVQSGTFEELMDLGGEFRDLVKRQIA